MFWGVLLNANRTKERGLFHSLVIKTGTWGMADLSSNLQNKLSLSNSLYEEEKPAGEYKRLISESLSAGWWGCSLGTRASWLKQIHLPSRAVTLPCCGSGQFPPCSIFAVHRNSLGGNCGKKKPFSLPLC